MTGNAFADGCVEPALQKAGLSNGATAEVSHRRPLSSSIGLCTLFLLVQMTSSPQYGDGCGMFGLVAGVFGSRTVSGIRLTGMLHGIQHRHVVGAQLE